MYEESEQTQELIDKITNNQHGTEKGNLPGNIYCIDDKVNLIEDKGADAGAQAVDTLMFGEFFGGLCFDENWRKSSYYFVSDSACQLAIITENVWFIFKCFRE